MLEGRAYAVDAPYVPYGVTLEGELVGDDCRGDYHDDCRYDGYDYVHLQIKTQKKIQNPRTRFHHDDA